MEAASEQVNYLWECGRCGTAQPEKVIFCTVCAAREGADNKTAPPADKIGKLNEAMLGAISWSLQHAQIKAADVLGHAAKKGHKLASLEALRSLSLPELEEVASNYIGANRLGATGSGLATGLPGGLLGFAAIPADISAVIYFSIRALSGISQAYSFETESETGQAVLLLVLAHACKLDTVTIGQRRLEVFTLARFLLKNPEPFGQLARACILKQLATYLTTDFAKTSWATFLPVVGSVVNSTTNFMFVGDVGKGGKVFYRTLLQNIVPTIATRSPGPNTIAPPVTVTIEVRELTIVLTDGNLKAALAYPLQTEPFPLVLVAWAGEAGNVLAERLAEKGFGALAPATPLDSVQLQQILAYLSQPALSNLPPNLQRTQPLLVGFGPGATAALEILGSVPPQLSKAVLYNPVGASRPVVTLVPVLLQWGSPQIDPGWAVQIKPGNSAALVSAIEYAGIGYDFANAASPEFSPKFAHQAWRETLDWLNNRQGR